jgi:hypothetical protein
MQAAIPVPPIFAPTVRFIAFLVSYQSFSAGDTDAYIRRLKNTIVGKTRGISVGVCGIAAEVVQGIQVLNVQVVLRR